MEKQDRKIITNYLKTPNQNNFQPDYRHDSDPESAMSTIKRLKLQLQFTPVVSNEDRNSNKESKLFETYSKMKTIISNLDNMSNTNGMDTQ